MAVPAFHAIVSPHIINIMAEGKIKVNIFPSKFRLNSYCLQRIHNLFVTFQHVIKFPNITFS